MPALAAVTCLADIQNNSTQKKKQACQTSADIACNIAIKETGLVDQRSQLPTQLALPQLEQCAVEQPYAA